MKEIEPLTPEQRKLAEDNIKLSSFVASQYMGRGIPFEDLRGDGYWALCLAARNFDDTRDNQFSTYACDCIKNYIKERLKQNDVRNALLDNLTWDDINSPSDTIDEYTEEDFLARISVLPAEEQYVIKSYVGLGERKKTITEIALELGKERHTVSNMIKGATSKINNTNP